MLGPRYHKFRVPVVLPIPVFIQSTDNSTVQSKAEKNCNVASSQETKQRTNNEQPSKKVLLHDSKGCAGNKQNGVVRVTRRGTGFILERPSGKEPALQESEMQGPHD